MFELLFIGGVIGFLVVYGIVLMWFGRRIKNIEEVAFAFPRYRRRLK